MALSDRIRTAAGRANTIEPIEPTGPQPQAPQHAPKTPQATPAAAKAQGAKPEAGKPPAYTTEPAAIKSRYFVEERDGERRYFEDYQRQRLAIRATDERISSKREDLPTIRAMILLADARGWSAIDIKGTPAFRREAWIEAHAAGLEVKGYKASDVDRQEADRRRAEQGLSVDNQIQGVSQAESPSRSDGAAASPKRAARSEKAAPAVDLPTRDEKFVANAPQKLSPDGGLVLQALSNKIDRQLGKGLRELAGDLKADIAAELIKRERAEGPVVLSADQRRAASAPEPTQERRAAPKPHQEPEKRRSRSL